MILTYVVTAALMLALVLQAATDRAPDLLDTRQSRSARRVLIVGLAIMLAYTSRACYRGVCIDAFMALGLLLLALAEVAFCMNRLFPHLFDHVHIPHAVEQRDGVDARRAAQ